MINELHLLWVPNFIAIGTYFLFGTKFSWNEETDTCFNVKRVLLDHNFDFLGCYLVITPRNLMVTTGYCSLPCGYCWWLLLVTARYCSFPLLVWTNISNHNLNLFSRNELQKTNTYLVFILHTVAILQFNFNKSLDLGLKKPGLYLTGLGLTLWYIRLGLENYLIALDLILRYTGLGLEKTSDYLTGVRLILRHIGFRLT